MILTLGKDQITEVRIQENRVVLTDQKGIDKDINFLEPDQSALETMIIIPTLGKDPDMIVSILVEEQLRMVSRVTGKDQEVLEWEKDIPMMISIPEKDQDMVVLVTEMIMVLGLETAIPEKDQIKMAHIQIKTKTADIQIWIEKALSFQDLVEEILET